MRDKVKLRVLSESNKVRDSLKWWLKREREQWILVAIVSWAAEKNRVASTTKPRWVKLLMTSRTCTHNISLGTFFLIGKMKLEIIFYWMGWTSYEFEWLGAFNFCLRG